MKTVDINFGQFEEWVKGHDADMIIGFASSRCSCPIARFLNKDGGTYQVTAASVYQLTLT